MIGIYKITSPSGKIYIGQSVDIEKRRKQYLKGAAANQPRLFHSITKYGWSTHVFEVVEECNIASLNERERYWQESHDVLGKKGLNCIMTKTNDRSGYFCQTTRDKMSKSQTGKKMSQEAKIKISEANLGKEGVKWTDEQRGKFSESRKGVKVKAASLERIQKVSQKMKGKVFTKDHCDKISASNMGRIASAESRAKISKANKGRIPVDTVKPVINKKTGEIFSSVKEAAIKSKLKLNTMYRFLRGTAKGKTEFDYYKEGENTYVNITSIKAI